MDLEFARATATHGNESVLLRFNITGWRQNPCILVDAGAGLSLDSQLGSNDYLAGILLTHAHTDHIEGIPDALRHRAPIYTSPETAAVLPQALSALTTDQQLPTNTPAELDNRLNPITEAETIFNGVQVHPITAGHIQGATAFLVTFADKKTDDSKRILITGDFTIEDIAGYQGLTQIYGTDIDVLLVNAATADNDTRTLTHAVNTTVQSVEAGDPTLICTNSFTATHIASLLEKHAKQSPDTYTPTIALVGTPASYFEKLSLPTSTITTLPSPETPHTLLNQYDIVISAPQNPADGGLSYQLFAALRQQGGQAIQVTTSQTGTPLESTQRVTSHTYIYHPHLSNDQLNTFIRRTTPLHTVFLHTARQSFRDQFMFTYTWANTQSDWFSLYKDGNWQAPPWVTEELTETVEESNSSVRADTRTARSPVALPPFARKKHPLGTDVVDAQALKPFTKPEKNAHPEDQQQTQHQDVLPVGELETRVIRRKGHAFLLVENGELPHEDGETLRVRLDER